MRSYLRERKQCDLHGIREIVEKGFYQVLRGLIRLMWHCFLVGMF